MGCMRDGGMPVLERPCLLHVCFFFNAYLGEEEEGAVWDESALLQRDKPQQIPFN